MVKLSLQGTLVDKNVFCMKEFIKQTSHPIGVWQDQKWAYTSFKRGIWIKNNRIIWFQGKNRQNRLEKHRVDYISLNISYVCWSIKA